MPAPSLHSHRPRYPVSDPASRPQFVEMLASSAALSAALGALCSSAASNSPAFVTSRMSNRCCFKTPPRGRKKDRNCVQMCLILVSAPKCHAVDSGSLFRICCLTSKVVVCLGAENELLTQATQEVLVQRSRFRLTLKLLPKQLLSPS